MAYHNQNAMYCSSAKYGSVTAWATNVAKTVGQMVRATAPALGDERVWLAYVAGTTNATTQPSWTTSRGDKIATDGSVSWIEVTGLPAVNGDAGNTPNWVNGAKNTNVSQGHIIKDAGGTHFFICTSSGNAGTSTEPTWNVGSLGATTTDAGVTWVYIGLVSSFTGWGGPHKTIVRALNTNWMDNGAGIGRQIVYVGHDHAETQSSSGMNFPGHGTNNLNNGNSLDIVCVSTSGSLPPASADLSTAGSISVTSSNSLSVGNGNYRWVYGLTFNTGNSSGINLAFNGDGSDRFYENCTFNIPAGAGAGAQIQFSGAGVQHFKNCTFTFSDSGHTFEGRGNNEFDNCTFSGTAPTTNGFIVNANNARMVFRNCDFSAWTNVTMHSGSGTLNSSFIFRDCLMPTGWSPGDDIANGMTNSSEILVFSRCNTSGVTNAWQFWQNDQAANLQADATVARSAGASDAGTPISWKIVTKVNVTMNSSDTRPPLIARWNSTTASNVTATVYGVINAGALPTNDYCFVDVDYLGSTGGTVGARKSSRIADYLATPAAVTADTSDWTSGAVTARQNSHAYVLGDAIKLASNPGRIFFCTTAGSAAGSEPGGYASAVDGGSVTDGSAVFRAGMRFKMSVTLTSPQPQTAGNVYAQIRFGAPSTTIYFDPLLTLS